MHLFHILQCSIRNRNVHISVLNGALWDMEQVHLGICEIGLLLWQLATPPVSVSCCLPPGALQLVYPKYSGDHNNTYDKIPQVENYLWGLSRAKLLSFCTCEKMEARYFFKLINSLAPWDVKVILQI